MRGVADRRNGAIFGAGLEPHDGLPKAMAAALGDGGEFARVEGRRRAARENDHALARAPGQSKAASTSESGTSTSSTFGSIHALTGVPAVTAAPGATNRFQTCAPGGAVRIAVCWRS